MDKEKAYKVFQELLEEYRESERVVNHDRSTKTYDEDEAELAEKCARFEKEMKKHLGLE